MAVFARSLVAILALLATPALAQLSPPSRPQVDAPELARLGRWLVGTSIRDVLLPKRLRPAAPAKADRAVTVRFWYPALAGSTPPIIYVHTLRRPGGSALEVRTAGIASADATLATGQRFPLVVLSHGYGGWGGSMSYLGENLASKGYVVAAIDHDDLPFADPAGFALSFGSTMLDRARDQRGVLARLLKDAAGAKAGPSALIDREKVALVGYSMGGYGALATAGADYDAKSEPAGKLPPDARAELVRGDPAAAKAIDALVLIAPWGGQPAQRSWTEASLAGVTAPTLIIAGDQDDIVDFRGGVRWIFDNLASAERRLLLYRDARHNVGGNPAPVEVRGDFAANEFFAEPVWRTERLNAINQHFITAFLDLTLKGETAKSALFDAPTGGGEWQGFKRRWALGFALQHAKPTQR